MRGNAWRLAAVVSISVLAASPARADAGSTSDSAAAAAEARAQYQLGTQAFQQKRYTEAALHFESAAAYRPHAVALYTAALAWDLASRPERAADAYSRALEVPGLDAKQTSTARDRVASLETTLGTVVVTGPEGWKVQLDTFTEVSLPARVHGGAGVHALSVHAPGKPIDRRDVTLEAGKVTRLELEEAPAPAPAAEARAPAPAAVAPPSPVSESFWSTRRVAGVGVAGVGVAALASTVVLGLSATSARDAYNAGPTREAFDHASSLETWTNVMLVGGAVLLAGGVALALWPDDGRERRARIGLAPTAGGAVLGGTF